MEEIDPPKEFTGKVSVVSIEGGLEKPAVVKDHTPHINNNNMIVEEPNERYREEQGKQDRREGRGLSAKKTTEEVKPPTSNKKCNGDVEKTEKNDHVQTTNKRNDSLSKGIKGRVVE